MLGKCQHIFGLYYNSVGNLIVRGIFTEPGDASIEARWVQRARRCCDVLFEVRVSATAEGT